MATETAEGAGADQIVEEAEEGPKSTATVTAPESERPSRGPSSDQSTAGLSSTAVGEHGQHDDQPGGARAAVRPGSSHA